jgi:hypothetical protein
MSLFIFYHNINRPLGQYVHLLHPLILSVLHVSMPAGCDNKPAELCHARLRYAPIIKAAHSAPLISLDNKALVDMMHSLGLFTSPTPSSRPGALPPPLPRSAPATAAMSASTGSGVAALDQVDEEEANIISFSPETNEWVMDETTVCLPHAASYLVSKSVGLGLSIVVSCLPDSSFGV